MGERGNIHKCVHRNIRRTGSGESGFYQGVLRRRRERQRRRRMLVSGAAILAAVCSVFLGAFCASFRSSASDGFKYYTQITVESGDTLWSLADGYIDYAHYRDKGRYVAEVRSINHLDEECRILAGQVLIVPYYSEVYVE